MAFINVKTMKDAWSSEVKTKLHREITDLIIDIAAKGKKEFEKFMIVEFEETSPENWSIGGNQASGELMAFINIKTMKGVWSTTEKNELHQKLAELIVTTASPEKQESEVIVIIEFEESALENWSMGGRQSSEKFITMMKE